MRTPISIPLSICLALIGFAGASGAAKPSPQEEAAAPDPTQEARLALGQRLFTELNFTNPATQWATSCSGCHTKGGNLPDRGERAFTDYTPRSLTATRAVTLRNTPTLLDAGDKELLGWDGAHAELEELILDKVTGPLYGWGDDGRQRALDNFHFTLLHEGGTGTAKSYVEEFRTLYDVDLEKLGAEEAVRWAARAIGDFVRAETSTMTSPWDAFVTQNRLHPGPNSGESAENYAYGVIYSRLGNQEGRGLVRRPQGFTRQAYAGFKTFFRTFAENDEPVGSCVLCHTPPLFRDGKFHDMGISEAEYEGVHGAGTAAEYEVPGQPSEATRSAATEGDRTKIDLGRFNVTGEASDAGAFATPTLRHLAGSDPYMHDGAYATLEDALRAKIRLSALAREGKLPNADPLLAKIEISEEDIPSLVAFLRQLEEVGQDRFREYLIHFADD